jgi:cyclophilin family peptidyl-prolyl cis-trans isomerase
MAAAAAGRMAAPTHRASLRFSVGKEASAPLRLELMGGAAPRTVDNFVRLCRGEGGRQYAGTSVPRVVPGFMAQGGSTDGKYGEAAGGGKFADETFALGHDGAGVLSMANAGEDTNGSQFFLTFGAQHHLDGKHVVFGRVAPDDVASMRVLRQIEAVGSKSGGTSVPVTITRCEVEYSVVNPEAAHV